MSSTLHDDIDIDVDNSDSESMDTAPTIPPFSPFASSSTTSYDPDDFMSVRSNSPQPSVFSFTPSMRSAVYRQEHGRGLNSVSEIYSLPADEEEIGRLDSQHEMFKIVMGWVPPLAEVLTSDPGVTKAVLDLGCGSGAWIMDVARAFPQCSAVGVDLVPFHPPLSLPNCRSEIDDINPGLGHYYDSFDVVHTRLISTGIKDYAELINQITHCLRPGGLIDIVECDLKLYHPDKTPFPPWSETRPTSEAPYICRWFDALRRASQQKGGDIDAAGYIHEQIRAQECFDEQDIVYKEYWCPTGPWQHKPQWNGVGLHRREVGEMMQEDIHAFLKGGRLLLLGSGMSPEEVDELEMNSHRELDECKLPLLVRIQNVYALKRVA